MKKLNLLLIPLIFSSLLIACGMPGPLYRAPAIQAIEKQSASEEKIKEQKNETLEDENSAS